MNKQIDYKGSIINYNIDGSSAKTVVLLHGFLEDLSMWSEFTKLYGSSYKIISIDLPGFGKSGIISDNHSMQLMAEVVNNILVGENVVSCFMVGHSMGGYVALAFADLFPKKLKGLVLFHSQASADDCHAKKNRDRTIGIVNNNHSKYISSFIPLLFAEENLAKFNNEIKNLIKSSLQTNDEGIIAALRGMRDRFDYTELLGKLEIPVLFIIGKRDSRIPLEKINQQILLPKISETLILEHVGHMGFIEAKDITYASVSSFIDRYNNYNNQ